LARNAITTFQTELQNNGPLQSCFTVYNNFYTFFSLHPNGIYTSASGSVVGGHCVKLVGWGTTNGQDYWTFANSWDTNWGDNGYFKMARGTNLCGIEGSMSEGFTVGQAAKLGIPHGIDPNVNTTYIVGGWQEQDDLTSEFVLEAFHEALTLVSTRIGRPVNVKKLVTAKTQVVAGVNFHFTAITEGHILEVKLHRNLKNEYSLTQYQFN
jgi:cathepsin B